MVCLIQPALFLRSPLGRAPPAASAAGLEPQHTGAKAILGDRGAFTAGWFSRQVSQVLGETAVLEKRHEHAWNMLKKPTEYGVVPKSCV